MLDGRHGTYAERARRHLLQCAGGIEWLYRASNDNPYRKGREGEGDNAEPRPTPSATASPSGTASPSATSVPSGNLVPPDLRPASAAPRRYPWPATLHPVVAAMPKEAETSIESVGKYILAKEPDPLLRVKALHDWVADRIAYDVPNYLAHTIPASDGDAQAVFQSRTAVCAGYADLLAALGKVTGDEILYVVGDARSQQSPMEGEGHAWNAARVDGTWYLVDATWDAGFSKGSAFEKQYRTAYLFTPPDQFAMTHFPDAAKWQLLERPLSRAEFFHRPVLAPAFFAHGLELRAPDRAQVSVSGSLDIAIGNPNGAFLMADWQPHGGGEAVPCTGNDHTAFHCVFPAKSTYDVRLYASQAQYGSYAYAGSVQVNARP